MSADKFTFKIVLASVIFNKKGKVLLAKRSEDEEILPGYWGIPGGKMEVNDTEDDAIEKELKREVKEEVGIEIKSLVYIESHSYKNEKIHICFTSDLKSGEPLALDETEKVGWFNLAEAKKLKLTPYTLERITRAYKIRRNST